MNKADGQGTRDRLSAVFANSLDTRAKTQDLARQAYQSRTQFHRLFRTVESGRLESWFVFTSSIRMLLLGFAGPLAKTIWEISESPHAKEGLELPAVETRILVAPNREEVVRVTTPVHGGQIPMTAPATLESEPTWS